MEEFVGPHLLSDKDVHFISFWMDFLLLKAYSYKSVMTLERQVLLRCGCEMKNSVAMYTQVFSRTSLSQLQDHVSYSKRKLLFVFLLSSLLNSEAYKAL